METERFIMEVEDKETGKKFYFCPNCGAKASASLKHCVSCGSSLEVMEGDKNLYSIRQIKEDGKN